MDSKSDKNSNKPKIKAAPIINKDFAHKPKAPMGKPMPRREEAAADKAAEVSAKAVEDSGSKEKVQAEAAADEPQKAPKIKKSKAEDKKPAKKVKAADNGEKSEEVSKKAAKTEEKAKDKKSEKKDEPYENAPNKPMRFKKIFDASTAPKEESKSSRKKSGDKKDGKKAERGGRRNDRNGQGGKSSESRQGKNSSRPQSCLLYTSGTSRYANSYKSGAGISGQTAVFRQEPQHV